MFSNFLKTAFRNLFRYKVYTGIHFLGLSLGMGLTLLIYLFVQHELSFDHFHQNLDNIYRVNEVEVRKSGAQEQRDIFGYYKESPDVDKYTSLPLPLGPALRSEVPEVIQFTRFGSGGAIVRKDKRVYTEDLRFVDPSFFEMFSFPLLEGSAEEVLDERNDVVITPDIAKKYFGNKNPVGETLVIRTYEREDIYTVSGIVGAPPVNSSIQFDFLLPVEAQPHFEKGRDDWLGFNTPLFIELADGVSPSTLDYKMKDIVYRHMSRISEILRNRRDLSEEDEALALTLTPFKDMHLDTSTGWEKQGNPMNILILSGIAILILLIACLNYISISLSRASGRRMEVGVRKVMGSTPGQIARQFWIESQVPVMLALVGAVILAELMLPAFNSFVERQLDISLLEDGRMLVALLVLAILTGLLAGSYPAVITSRFRPAKILSSKSSFRLQPGFIKGAVVVQFAMSAFLITISIVMYRQMEYINRKDLGFDSEQVIVLPTYAQRSDEGERLLRLMKEELKNDPSIGAVSGSSASFNRSSDRSGIEMPDGEVHYAYVYRVDPGYLDLLGIELAGGRNFSKGRAADINNAIIVNRTLVEELQIEEPIGAEVPWRDSTNRQIIGVVDDYHFLSLTAEVKPVLLHINPEAGSINHLLFKIDGQQIPQALASVEKSWQKLAPGLPFDFSFLDEDLAAQYASYTRWMRAIGLATVLAIIIACLGLFGLAGIMAFNRTKEIGIRKVFGAGILNILLLLNKDLVKLALLATALGGPVAWYLIRQWLTGFEYQADISWVILLFSAAACLAVTLLAVSYHSLKAALTNPVKALRYE